MIGQARGKPAEDIQILVWDEEPDKKGSLTSLESETLQGFDLSIDATIPDFATTLSEREVDVAVAVIRSDMAFATGKLRRLLEAAQGTPLVVWLGDDTQLAEEALALGASDYLLASDSPHRVRQTLSKAAVHNRMTHKLQSVSEELAEVSGVLSQMTLVDPLTTLLNERGVQSALASEQQKADGRASMRMTAIVIDMFDLPKIGQKFGYAVGEALLEQAARAVRLRLRPDDHKARVRDHYFLILLTDTDLEDGSTVADRLLTTIHSIQVPLDPDETKLDARIAVAPVSSTQVDIDSILGPMLQHLATGPKETQQIALRGDEVSEKMQNTLHRKLEALTVPDNYFPVAQVIVPFDDDTEYGYELLTRAKLPDLGMPVDFFGLALRNNKLTELERATLTLAGHTASYLPEHLVAHINIFPSTLRELDPAEILDRLGTKGAQRCIEISEKELIGHPKELAHAIEKLRAGGMTIAMDDVGFGRSSLEALLLLNPEIIKIDRGLVTYIDQRPEQRQALERLIKIADRFDIKLVAEGIEREEELTVLKSMGVPLGQGYLLGKPEPF